MLAAHVAPFGFPSGADEMRFRLVAPFEPKSSQWASLPWRNLYDRSGRIYSVTTRAHRGESEPAWDPRRLHTLEARMEGTVALSAIDADPASGSALYEYQNPASRIFTVYCNTGI
jgi:hypothetical protein